MMFPTALLSLHQLFVMEDSKIKSSTLVNKSSYLEIDQYTRHLVNLVFVLYQVTATCKTVQKALKIVERNLIFDENPTKRNRAPNQARFSTRERSAVKGDDNMYTYCLNDIIFIVLCIQRERAGSSPFFLENFCLCTKWIKPTREKA